MHMAALIATCFSLSLLLGNICPMRLAAYATHPSAEAEKVAMTPAHGERMACRNQTLNILPPTLAFPATGACASGHCLAKGDPTVWLQVAFPSPLPVTAATEISPSFLNPIVPAPRIHFASSARPPPRHLHSIVLRI